MLQLSEIWIYPVKSLGGIQLQQAQITDRGLEYDRRWMLVNSNGTFLTQREYPELALFQPEIIGDTLKIIHKEKLEFVSIPLKPTISDKHKNIKVAIWDDFVNAVVISQLVNDWFSKLLGFPVLLVYMPQESIRKIDSNYAITGDEINSFSDGYPFLVIGQTSLNDLNSRLEVKVSMNRFRPNFVFINGHAYEEEAWKEFNIGEVSFIGVKPCARCVVTTVDQDKGIVSGKEPLNTLAKYRNFGNKVLFGQNVIGNGFGSVSIGDKITVFTLIEQIS